MPSVGEGLRRGARLTRAGGLTGPYGVVEESLYIQYVSDLQIGEKTGRQIESETAYKSLRHKRLGLPRFLRDFPRSDWILGFS